MASSRLSACLSSVWVCLIGSMYTGLVGAMKDGGCCGAARVVISTFVDFENWAKKDRLAVPDNATLQWDSSKQAPTAFRTSCVRRSAIAACEPGCLPVCARWILMCLGLTYLHGNAKAVIRHRAVV